MKQMEIYNMVRCIIGDFKPKADDLIIDAFTPDCVRKNNFSNKRVILYAESLGLKKSDFEFIAKQSTADVVLVCETKKTINGVRQSKNFKIEYSEGYCEEMNPFDVGKLILTSRDRDFVFDFLKTNKISMWLIVKYLVSASIDFSIKTNKKTVAWLDENLYRVRPEFLYAKSAYFIKPEPKSYFKWRYPKKKEED